VYQTGQVKEAKTWVINEMSGSSKAAFLEEENSNVELWNVEQIFLKLHQLINRVK